MKKENRSAYFKFISSMLIFGTIGIFRKYISLPSGTLAFVRGIVGSFFILVYILIKKGRASFDIERGSLVLLIISGMLMGLNWLFLFEAYNYTSVQVATLCYYMEPTIITVLSPFVFKEKISLKKLFWVIVAMIGMIMVSGIAGTGSLSSRDLLGIGFGLLAAVLYSSVVILNKKTEVNDAYGKTIIQLFSAAVVLIPYILLRENQGSYSIGSLTLIMTLVVGVVHTGFAYVMYFGSMSDISGQSVALLSYIDPVSALILSAVFLNETLTLSGTIGAILIIGSALIGDRIK